MRHTVELLVSVTLATYCVWRCYAVVPLAIAEAHALVDAYRGRTREMEQIAEPVD